MTKKTEPESFEVTEYSAGANEEYDKYSTICKIIDEKGHENPAYGIKVALAGDLLKIYYHCSEINLPVHMKEVDERAHDALNDAIKFLKKEFKSRTKKSLDLKEKKDMANYTIQKVNLNERYYFVSWRFYEIV